MQKSNNSLIKQKKINKILCFDVFLNKENLPKNTKQLRCFNSSIVLCAVGMTMGKLLLPRDFVIKMKTKKDSSLASPIREKEGDFLSVLFFRQNKFPTAPRYAFETRLCLRHLTTTKWRVWGEKVSMNCVCVDENKQQNNNKKTV